MEAYSLVCKIASMLKYEVSFILILFMTCRLKIVNSDSIILSVFHGNEKDCAPFSRPGLELVQKQKNGQINYLTQELSCI